MTDLVSFSLRFVIDIAPAEESEAARKARGDKRAWLLDRGYRVIEILAGEIEADIEGALDRIEQSISRP
jgi:tRNA/rRNA methyltransferase